VLLPLLRANSSLRGVSTHPAPDAAADMLNYELRSRAQQ
jgi:hypothetical protein